MTQHRPPTNGQSAASTEFPQQLKLKSYRFSPTWFVFTRSEGGSHKWNLHWFWKHSSCHTPKPNHPVSNHTPAPNLTINA